MKMKVKVKSILWEGLKITHLKQASSSRSRLANSGKISNLVIFCRTCYIYKILNIDTLLMHSFLEDKIGALFQDRMLMHSIADGEIGTFCLALLADLQDRL
jgi:hypothetical protein